jgi:hypothetical protein
MPPAIFGAFERLAATPLTVSRSEKVALWVSIVLWMSVAIGGIMFQSEIESVGTTVRRYKLENV